MHIHRVDSPVSIVMGSYNGGRYIAEQLGSILNQTRLPAEIIIADDGSSDDTLEVIRATAARSPVPIRTIVNPVNLGFGLNFMGAARQATCDLVAFADQDDVWHPDKLARCAAAFLDPHAVLVVHQAELIDKAGSRIGDFNQYIDRDRYVLPREGDPWGGFFGFSMVFRRSLLALIPPAKDGYYLGSVAQNAHDRLIYGLAMVAGRICEISEKLVDYRQHDANVFGVGEDTPPALGTERLKLSAARVRAASAMIELLSAAPDRIEGLPAFDRARALAWWNAILFSQQKRDALYRAESRLGGLGVWAANIAGGVYASDRVGRGALNAGIKDLFSIIVRR